MAGLFVPYSSVAVSVHWKNRRHTSHFMLLSSVQIISDVGNVAMSAFEPESTMVMCPIR